MKVTSKVETNFRTREVKKSVEEATRLAIRDTVVEIQNDAVHDSPWNTGHNRRSLVGEVSGMGVVVDGSDAEPETVVDDGGLEGAIYSTSGYGGFIETGTVHMNPRPYIKPAMDRRFTKEKFSAKVRKHLD